MVAMSVIIVVAMIVLGRTIAIMAVAVSVGVSCGAELLTAISQRKNMASTF